MANIIERFINIVVNNSQANANLKTTEDSLKKVDDNTKKATVSTKNYTDEVTKNGGAMAILNQLTGGLANNFKDAYESIQLSSTGLKGFRAALAATGIGLAVIAIGALVENWDAVKDAISQTTKEAKILRDIQGELTSKLKETYTELFRVKSAFDQARRGAISKEEALKTYNETLGDTLGKAKTLEEAEQIYAAKTADYIRATQLRITSQLLLARAAEESAKVATGENLDLSFWEKAGVAIKGYFTGVGDALSDSIVDANKESTESINNLLELAEKYQKQADELSKTSGLNFNKTLNETNKLTEIYNKLLEKQLGLIKSFGKETSNTVKNIVDINSELKGLIKGLQGYGETYDKFKNLSDLWYDNRDALIEYNNALVNLEKQEANAIATINKNTGLSNQQRQEQIKGVKDLVQEQRNIINTLLAEANLRGNVNDLVQENINLGFQYFTSIQDNYDRNIKALETEIDVIERRKNLQLDLIKLENTILEFEKFTMDERFNNSNAFEQINQNIIDISNKRKQIIEENYSDEISKLQELSNEYSKDGGLIDKALSEFTTSDENLQNRRKELIAQGFTEEQILTDENYRELQRKQNDANAKLFDVRQSALENDVSLKQVTAAKEIEIAAETANSELEIESNKLEQKRLIREEELERERMYYNSVVGIAEEAQGFLSGLATLGGKNSQKFAEAALKLQKAAGVARVAIALQEEIRGIWSNPALTALPDTGISKKTALTVAAAARGALSIATILSQRLNGGANTGLAGAGGTGGGVAAQFNIVEASQNNQLAQLIGRQQQQPIRTYVVGSDVSTQQALDRNRIQNATFL
jgi:hypothetical protein